MSDKGSGSFLSPYQRHPRPSARGLALFLIITLAAAGLWVSPAVAAYIDIFNSSVLLAVPAAVDDFYAATEDADLVIPAPGVLHHRQGQLSWGQNRSRNHFQAHRARE